MDGIGRLPARLPPQRPLHSAQSVPSHIAATLRLATPLAVAQLAQMAMGVTDTMLLGRLGGDALAIGGLGTSLLLTVMLVLQGVVASVSVLVAQARGAGRDASVPALYWTGMALTVLLMVPAFALFSMAEPLLIAVGEPPALAHDVGAFVSILRWSTPGQMVALGLMRAILPAIGGGGMILWTTVVAAIANGGLCYGLIHGAWGLPAFGMHGAAMATVITCTALGLALLALLHGRARWRRLVAWSRPQPALLWAMLRLGVPIAATFAVEAGLFLAVALLIGLLGPAALAAQQVALNALSIAFMIPLGIAQAANVRVGHHIGAADGPGARRAGLVAIGLGAAFEVGSALVLLLAPETVAGAYLDPRDSEAFAIAVGLLGVATVFQVADGVQCVAIGALRGLGDTRVPFALTALGYWGIGFPAAWWLTMRGGAGPAGAWWGLALGLSVVAVLLTARFMRRSRLTPAPILLP